MENLRALIYKGDITPYQRALAQREFEGMVERLEIYEKAVKNNAVLPHVSGSLQDIQEIIEFLQWVYRKVDKGDTPEETVRMLLMNRVKIDNIKFDSNDC